MMLARELTRVGRKRVARLMAAAGPNRFWVADITHLPTHEGWLFLGEVEDMWSRRIGGWSMRADLRADLVVGAISMAVAPPPPEARADPPL